MMFFSSPVLVPKASRLLKAVLNSYQKIFGQHFNLSKSKLFFGKCRAGTKAKAMEILNIHDSALPSKYLEAPFFQGRPYNDFFSPLVDSIRKRLTGWRCKSLSFAGRLILVRHVLGSIPTHSLMVFPLPNSTIKAMEALGCNFMWSNSYQKTQSNLIA